MNKTVSVIENCKAAKNAAPYLITLSSEEKNQMLSLIADALVCNTAEILEANKRDLENNSDKPKHILDRLALSNDRINGISEGLRKLVLLDDPIHEEIESWTNAAGLLLKKVRVPLGVIGIIYEARPNVTVDAIGLCLKTGNAVVLRGSRDAIESNKVLVSVISRTLVKNGFRADFIQLVEDLSHESSKELMTARGFVDVLIPRGSARLINAVVEQSTVPVIETGTGNCHVYVHSSADLEMAKTLILNGKLRRQSVCNATESILVDRDIAKEALPLILKPLTENGITVYGCKETCDIYPEALLASEQDYYTEYLGPSISCKVVNDYNEAILHINKYGSAHSDSIVASDKEPVDAFMRYVDSAVVYHNAPTSWTDGFEFGLGAEMGISTQKLHARGPLGLRELTTIKYCVEGNGQIRK